MSPQLVLTTTFLLACATSVGAQVASKPAPNLPPYLPDVKTPAVIVPTTPGLPRDESRARPAQSATKSRNSAAAEPTSAIDFTRVHFDEPGDGRTWVRGRTYKASFDGEGATYIPFLGSDAPRDRRRARAAARAGNRARGPRSE